MGQLQCCLNDDISKIDDIKPKLVPIRKSLPKKIAIAQEDEWWGTCYYCSVLTWNVGTEYNRYECKRCVKKNRKK